jgi:hypothetical protein
MKGKKTGLGWTQLIEFESLFSPDSQYFSPDGTLKMRIRFVHLANSFECKSEQKGCVKELVKIAEANVLEDFSSLLQTGLQSDLKIETRDENVFYAHKAILAGTRKCTYRLYIHCCL